MTQARNDRSSGVGTAANRSPEGPTQRSWSGELATVRIRALFAIPLIALFLVLGGGAEACPLTNPDCAVNQVKEVAKDPTNPVPPVEDPTDEVVETVDDTVDTVDKTVNDTTKEVVETVDETLNPGNGSVDTPPPPEDPDPRPEGDKDPETRVKSNQNVRGSGGTDGRVALGGGLDLSLRPDGDPALGAGTLTEASPAEATEDGGGLAESALEAVKDFAFPLLLTLLVGVFLAIQHRFDRRDPKLALAPVVHDYLSFE